MSPNNDLYKTNTYAWPYVAKHDQRFLPENLRFHSKNKIFLCNIKWLKAKNKHNKDIVKCEMYRRIMFKEDFAIEGYNSRGFYAQAGSSFHVQFQWTLHQLSVVLLQMPQGKDNPTDEPSVYLQLCLLLSDWQGRTYCQQVVLAHVLSLWHALSARALYVYPTQTAHCKLLHFVSACKS